MESSPRLARLLADSLDVPVGSLRAMAEQGELTADKLLRALTDTKFTASIDAEFKQMPVTFDQAMRSEEHKSELQSLMRISYAVFCLKKKQTKYTTQINIQ